MDARGTATITKVMTTDFAIGWDDIDPTVFIDDDGQADLFLATSVTGRSSSTLT